MANLETRRLRVELHNQFDPLWKGVQERPCPNGTWRAMAYRWLAMLVSRHGQDVHIGEMNADEATRALAMLDRAGQVDLLAFAEWEKEDRRG